MREGEGRCPVRNTAFRALVCHRFDPWLPLLYIVDARSFAFIFDRALFACVALALPGHGAEKREH